MNNYAPIVIFAYKKLDCFQQTVNALLKNDEAQHSTLFIFIDGAKNKMEEEQIKEVSSFAHTISGFKDINIHTHSTNQGLAYSIIKGVSKVLETYNSVIVLEDDVITSNNFLSYMNQSLTFYQNNQKVASISGLLYNGIKIPQNYEYNTLSHPKFTSISWGTWQDRWNKVKWNLQASDLTPQIEKKLDYWSTDLFPMLKKQQEGKIDSWAIRFVCFHIINDLVSVFPNISKTKHIGDNEEGTHVKRFLLTHRPKIDNTNNKYFLMNKDTTVLEQINQEFKGYKQMKSEELDIIEHILTQKEFLDNPPILIDIGASGSIHSKWLEIAKYSYLIAFDPDERDVDTIQENKDFKKVFFINSVVSNENIDKQTVYLTHSPHCSSTLKPSKKVLDYNFSNLFEVENTTYVKSMTIDTVLKELNLEKIDWMKTDSQGIDLKVFQSYKNHKNIIAVEFEPGVIDSYETEDKLYDILKYMDNDNFWISECNIKGDYRIHRDISSQYSSNDLFTQGLKKLNKNPGWAEITYFNSFKNLDSKREILLGIVFSFVEGNLGFALELTHKILDKYNDSSFKVIQEFLLNKIIEKTLGNHELNALNVLERQLEDDSYNYILYGFGQLGKVFYSKYKDKYNITQIIDNKQPNLEVDNIKITTLENIKYQKEKVILTVLNENSKKAIKKDLQNKLKLDDEKLIEC